MPADGDGVDDLQQTMDIQDFNIAGDEEQAGDTVDDILAALESQSSLAGMRLHGAPPRLQVASARAHRRGARCDVHRARVLRRAVLPRQAIAPPPSRPYPGENARASSTKTEYISEIPVS